MAKPIHMEMKRLEEGGDTFTIKWKGDEHRTIEKTIADGEAWANGILARDGIKYIPKLRAYSLANAKIVEGYDGAKEIHIHNREFFFACLVIDSLDLLRTELERATANDNEQATRCALLMMHFCRAFDAGYLQQHEAYFSAGYRSIYGGVKGGRKRSNATKEDRELIKREMAQVPEGGRMAAYQRLARKLRPRVGLRTIQRIASEK